MKLTTKLAASEEVDHLAACALGEGEGEGDDGSFVINHIKWLVLVINFDDDDEDGGKI